MGSDVCAQGGVSSGVRSRGLMLYDPAAHEPLTDVPWSAARARAAIHQESLLAAGGELTWTAGPLAKGPGLCHGTAGNGYAFLKLHRRTGQERWLDRARAFAMHALGQAERARAE